MLKRKVEWRGRSYDLAPRTRSPRRRRPLMRAVRATRNATASFLLLFGLTLGYSILEAARDALFLARFPATRLPIAYLGIALAVIIVHILFPARRSGPGSGRRLLVELVLAALALLAFAGLHARAPRRLDVPLLYVLVGVLGTMLMVRVWVLVGGAFDIGQARRSFARIAAGGLVGSISGAGFAAYQLRRAPAESLLPIAAVVWLATALVPLGLQLPAAAARPPATEPREASLGRMYRARYAWRLFWMITLATVVATVGDFLFKASIAADTTPGAVGAVLATLPARRQRRRVPRAAGRRADVVAARRGQPHHPGAAGADGAGDAPVRGRARRRGGDGDESRRRHTAWLAAPHQPRGALRAAAARSARAARRRSSTASASAARRRWRRCWCWRRCRSGSAPTRSAGVWSPSRRRGSASRRRAPPVRAAFREQILRGKLEPYARHHSICSRLSRSWRCSTATTTRACWPRSRRCWSRARCR